MVSVLKKVKLLVVEDPSEYADAISEQVQLCQHEFNIDCQIITTDEDIHEAVRKFSPSIILMNPLSYGTRGLEILGVVSSTSSVMALSDERTPALEAILRKSGAICCVQKTEDPEDIQHLLARIANLAPEISIEH